MSFLPYLAKSFTPLGIAGGKSNLSLWLDAQSSSYVTRDSSDLVSQWTDKSGNNNHFTSAGGDRPTWTQNQINGKPSVFFDGTQKLTGGSGLYGISASANTMCLVSRRATETGAYEVMYSGDNGTTARYYMAYPSTAGFLEFKNRNGAAGTVFDTLTATNPAKVIGYRSGTTQGIIVNGKTAVPNNNGTDYTATNVTIGSLSNDTVPFIGDLCELLIYNRLLTATEIDIIEKYFDNKWGL